MINSSFCSCSQSAFPGPTRYTERNLEVGRILRVEFGALYLIAFPQALPLPTHPPPPPLGLGKRSLRPARSLPASSRFHAFSAGIVVLPSSLSFTALKRAIFFFKKARGIFARGRRGKCKRRLQVRGGLAAAAPSGAGGSAPPGAAPTWRTWLPGASADGRSCCPAPSRRRAAGMEGGKPGSAG